jgi:iron complex transport system substrate-binding protein
MRICSLLPSATEIVAALGLADALVGVSDECDWPPEVRDLPVVSATRIETTSLSSPAIDRAVRDALSRGGSLYAIDAELIEKLAPDLILTQDLCTVCAVSSQQVGALCSVEAETVSLDAHTIAEIEHGVISLAARLGVSERGREVVARMQETIAAVRRTVEGAPVRRVFVAEWLDPPYAAGHWVPEMVTLAGGQELLGRTGVPSRPVSWEAVLSGQPELVVAAPCGFDHKRAAAEAQLPGLGCRVVAVDSNSYFARPAPRVADGVAQLAFLIHPERAPDPGLPYIELLPARSVRPKASRLTRRRLRVHLR